ncbi:sensor histidine kinase [Nonomuraea sp. NPDC059023]|uniref:sensor histidine kinase n=1 Tax=unclassified Nonomuraea TaxID=2593643 RepID=UPI00368994DC
MDLFARRLSRAQLIALDCAFAWVCVLYYLADTADADAPGWIRLALPLALAVPLAVRRVWPLAVFAVVTPAVVFAIMTGFPSLAYVSPAYAAYLVASASSRRLPINSIAIFSVLVLVTLLIAGVPGGVTWVMGETASSLAAVCTTFTFGLAIRERRAFAARDAARKAEQAVTEERLRIARELHDVVAHSVGLIAVKAGVARHVFSTRPEDAREALGVIETASRNAMVEMRHVLGVLRSAEEPDLGPAPGLDGLPELAERARLGGVEVELDVGDVSEVPEGVSLSAYRIVQEALTNVVKHAAPARSRVSVAADTREVRIEVTDDGPGWRVLPATGAGHGLVGMRERVMMYGGAFEAGPGAKGFRVRAALPYGEVP